MAPSPHDYKIVDWDVEPQHKQKLLLSLSYDSGDRFQFSGLRKFLSFVIFNICLRFNMGVGRRE